MRVWGGGGACGFAENKNRRIFSEINGSIRYAQAHQDTKETFTFYFRYHRIGEIN